MPENTAFLPRSASGLIDLLYAEALAHDLTYSQRSSGLDVSTQYGMISARIEDEGVRLRLFSEDHGQLHALRDAVNAHVEGRIAVDWEGVRIGRPANFTILTVARIEKISPSFIRLSLNGPTGHFAHGGFHVRLIAPGSGDVMWPEIDKTGRTIWPDKSALPHRPVYTIAGLQNDGVDIDVFCHSNGRTQAWAERMAIGSPVGVVGPGGSGLPEADTLSLWGDETALPSIRRILRDVPGDTVGRVTIAVRQPGDILALEHDGFEIRWIVRDSSTTLGQMLVKEGEPKNGAYLWFASGAQEVAIARSHAAKHGVQKQHSYIAAFWK